MIETIGWLSSVLFALCGVPLAYESYKSGHSRGVSASFLWMWFVGELLAIVYVLGKIGLDGPLLFNYTVNIAFIGIVLKYKYWERE